MKTFFSSSSGGHTASIQDVWTGLDPQAVLHRSHRRRPGHRRLPLGPDRACRTPRSRRRSGPTTRTAAAGSTTRRPSPYVRHVDLAAAGLVGLRALGDGQVEQRAVVEDAGHDPAVRPRLKSSKYWFSKSGISGTLTSYQQTDSRLAWVGTVVRRRGTRALRVAATPTPRTTPRSASRSSTAPVCRWIGNRAPAYGVAEVWIDGAKVATDRSVLGDAASGRSCCSRRRDCPPASTSW